MVSWLAGLVNVGRAVPGLAETGRASMDHTMHADATFRRVNMIEGVVEEETMSEKEGKGDHCWSPGSTGRAVPAVSSNRCCCHLIAMRQSHSHVRPFDTSRGPSHCMGAGVSQAIGGGMRTTFSRSDRALREASRTLLYSQHADDGPWLL